MGDKGLLCTICNAQDHRASSCPKRNQFRQSGGYTEIGKWRTRSLFDDAQAYTSKLPPFYTLKDHDTEYPSLKRLYLAEGDLTEYSFANKYLGGWDHWQFLLQSEWFIPHAQKWRTELELKLTSEALVRIREEAEADGRNAFAANKFLVSQGISKKAEPSRRGRPSKDEIKRAAAEQAFSEQSITEDLKRLELN